LREIALLLDAYNIHPAYIHSGRKTERGYRVKHFATAFSHYLPEFPTRERASIVSPAPCPDRLNNLRAEVTAERARLSHVRSLLSSLAAIISGVAAGPS